MCAGFLNNMGTDYSDTGRGLPDEVRLDYLRNAGWTRLEISRVYMKEYREYLARQTKKQEPDQPEKS